MLRCFDVASEWRGARSWALVMALAGLCASAPSPAAAAQFEASTIPTEAVFPSTREISYRIDVLAGTSDESFVLTQAPPSWPQGGVRAGAPAYHVQTSLEGSGELIPGSIAASPPGPSRGLVLPCDGAERFAPGPPFGARRDLVRLPAGARATLVTTWRLSTQAPFSSTDYRPRITATVDNMSQLILLPSPQIAGPTGVPIRLLKAGPGDAGKIVRVRGRTAPALVGQRLSLRVTGPVRPSARPVVATPEQFRTIARIRVDRLGRFDYRWRPRRPGLYGAYATYLGQPPAVLRDRSCPILIKVG
jgi:hypothetical protein